MSPRSAVRRLAAANLISQTGTDAAVVALLFVLYERTGSARWISTALLLLYGVHAALTPLAGALGDRLDRRGVMIASDLLAAACWAGLASSGSPASLLALAFLARAVETPFFPASSGAVPNLVPSHDLAWANGTIAAGSSIGYLAGPALGGALVAWVGPAPVFLLNAGSFVLSAAIVASVRGRFTGQRSAWESDTHRGLRAGFSFMLREPVLRLMTFSFTLFALAVGSVIVAELPLAESFAAGPFGYGLIATSFGLGALLGAIAARRVPARFEHRALVLCSFATAVGFAAAGFAPVFSAVLGVMVISGMSDGVVDVGAQVLLQRRTPDAVRSRVVAALDALWLGGLAVSFAFAGWLVDAVGPRTTYMIVGVGCAASAAILLPLLRSDVPAPDEAPALPSEGRIPA